MPTIREILCRLIGILFAVGPLAAQQQAVPAWQLVYAVDSTGTPTFGEKAQLLAAVRAGLPVRIGWGIPYRLPDGTSGGIEHVAEAAFLTIHHGEVFAQIAPILGQAPSAREPVVTFRTEGNRLWYALLDTTGRLHHYFTGGAEAQTTRTPTHWYVAGSAGTNQRRLY
jgi:hypothetical protein